MGTDTTSPGNNPELSPRGPAQEVGREGADKLLSLPPSPIPASPMYNPDHGFCSSPSHSMGWEKTSRSSHIS
ncbi:hypothetical protein EYF80_060296 [Liparis tanakae]|uniref:Uncharacterized protein n=1 Tax=Liparis tanakae TaxID=230148 RepID=A0A4Z2EKZ1_9TELE|nr:hypothetical protein EYF80_060296 [Liparis tanakae]